MPGPAIREAKRPGRGEGDGKAPGPRGVRARREAPGSQPRARGRTPGYSPGPRPPGPEPGSGSLGLGLKPGPRVSDPGLKPAWHTNMDLARPGKNHLEEKYLPNDKEHL